MAVSAVVGSHVDVHFTSPRQLPRPGKLPGRVVVLDVAFAADGMGTSFAEITKPFIDGLGDRLAAWVDHHDHDRHAEYRADARFVLASKAQHGACPEMVTPDLVRTTGPIGSILCHLDGGTPGQVGLLAVPVGDLAADGGDETIWILRGERPGAASNRASLPPGVTRMDVLASPAAPVRVRNGIEYALTTRWRQAALSSAASDSGRLVVAYRGPGDRCLLELREGQSAIEYVGEILRHSDLEILPSATPLRRR